MKKALVIFFFVCATPALGQVQGWQLSDTTFTFWAKLNFPATYAVIFDTVAAKDLWAQYHLDSTATEIERRISDSLQALRNELSGGGYIESELNRITRVVLGDTYSNLIKDDSTEIYVDDTCTVYARVYCVAHSLSPISDTAASYELRITVQRRGTTLTIKDTTLTIMHEDNPDWNIRFNNSRHDTLRVEAVCDIEDTVFFAATVEVERACYTLNDYQGGGGTPPPASGFEIRPDSLTWTDIATVVPDSLQPANLMVMREPFDDLDSLHRYSESLPDTAFVAVSSTGELTVDNNTAGAKNDVMTFGPYVNDPTMFISVDVLDHPDAATTYDNIGVGIAQDANNFIYASYDDYNNLARIQVKLGGVNNFYNTGSLSLTPPFRFAFSNVNGYCTFWYHDGLGWVQSVEYSSSTLRNIDLTTWRSSITVATPNSSEWVFDSLNYSPYGRVGIRDMVVIADENGVPYMTGDTVYFTATSAGHQAQTNTMGIYSLDLGTQELRQESVILTKRTGATMLDVASHIVRYGNDSMRVFVSSWGNGFGNPLGILTIDTTVNLLTNKVHTLAGLDTTVQGRGSPAVGWYDPHTMKIDGTWYFAYVATDDLSFAADPFYPCLDSSNGDLYATNLVAAGSDSTNYEGVRIIPINNTFYVLAGTDDYFAVWDRYMNPLGTMRTYIDGGVQTQPHPMVFPYGSYQYLISFDNTAFNGAAFSWGDLIIRRADRYYP